MPILLLFLRLFLAAVFLAAAVGKFLDRPGSRRAFVGFGLPEALARPLAVVLPAAEMVVALALLPPATARLGAVAALGMLVAFSCGIAYNLARGRHPDCHCFGQFSSAPAGPATLLRNIGLAAVAGLILWQGWDDAGPGPLDWSAGLSPAEFVGLGLGVAGVVSACVVGWFALGLARSLGRLRASVAEIEAELGDSSASGSRSRKSAAVAPGLPIGRIAPGFELADVDGRPFSLESMVGSRPVLLAFVDPDCAPCRALLPDLRRWQAEEEISVVPVSRGGQSMNLGQLREHALEGVLIQRDREIAAMYEVSGTPSAVLIGRDGRIASSVAAGADAIRELVARTPRHVDDAGDRGPTASTGSTASGRISDPGRRQLHTISGQVAPPFALPDLDGRVVELSDFRGKDTMILFWNPTCSFCSSMAREVRDWARRSASVKAALVLVALGSREANVASDLGATILLDPSMETFGSFGATGTPVAIRVDRRGRVASPLVVGTNQVRGLAASIGLANPT